MFVPFSYFSVKTTLGQSLGKLNFCLNFLKEENERNFFCKQLDLKKEYTPVLNPQTHDISGIQLLTIMKIYPPPPPPTERVAKYGKSFTVFLA